MLPYLFPLSLSIPPFPFLCRKKIPKAQVICNGIERERVEKIPLSGRDICLISLGISDSRTIPQNTLTHSCSKKRRPHPIVEDGNSLNPALPPLSLPPLKTLVPKLNLVLERKRGGEKEEDFPLPHSRSLFLSSFQSSALTLHT